MWHPPNFMGKKISMNLKCQFLDHTLYIGQNYPDINTIKFYAKITQLVWTHILELWTTAHNQDNTKATKQFPPNILSDINGIFTSWDWLPLHTQDLIFQLTKEELLTRPKLYIQTWINNSKSFICNEL